MLAQGPVSEKFGLGWEESDRWAPDNYLVRGCKGSRGWGWIMWRSVSHDAPLVPFAKAYRNVYDTEEAAWEDLFLALVVGIEFQDKNWE
ncbi:MAG: hypothetical protein OXH72_11860 [Caldilineaceae bacterium]|nr:hypothetical protein [Caldilineaceae bacterium]